MAVEDAFWLRPPVTTAAMLLLSPRGAIALRATAEEH